MKHRPNDSDAHAHQKLILISAAQFHVNPSTVQNIRRPFVDVSTAEAKQTSPT